MSATEKKIIDVNVGDRVEVYHEGRPDFKMMGHVVQNDDMCVIQRDDVAPVKQYVRNAATQRTECNEVYPNIYVFGGNVDVMGDTPLVAVKRI